MQKSRGTACPQHPGHALTGAHPGRARLVRHTALRKPWPRRQGQLGSSLQSRRVHVSLCLQAGAAAAVPAGLTLQPAWHWMMRPCCSACMQVGLSAHKASAMSRRTTTHYVCCEPDCLPTCAMKSSSNSFSISSSSTSRVCTNRSSSSDARAFVCAFKHTISIEAGQAALPAASASLSAHQQPPPLLQAGPWQRSAGDTHSASCLVQPQAGCACKVRQELIRCLAELF